MPSIHILPTALQNQIAAGEVVERPASIVKELIENSIDAGASRISVEIDNGGKDRILITDNGHGMDEKDAKLSIQRYATSKLKSQEDLQNIYTFGFRGEALASISSVSEFSLDTKTESNHLGTSLKIHNGKNLSIEQKGSPKGTQILIKNLFQFLPARLKYLKSAATEFSYILKAVQETALIHTDKSFFLKHNGKTILELNQETSDNYFYKLKNRILELLGRDYHEKLRKIEFHKPEIIVRGFTGIPGSARNNRKSQYIFVNKRSIKSPLISAAVGHAYKSLLPHGKFPLFVLDIEITPDLIDVNIHPRKEEIKFLRSSEIYTLIKNIFESALKNETEFHSTENVSTKTFKNFQEQINRTSSQQDGNTFYKHHEQRHKKYSSDNIKESLSFSKEILRTPETENPKFPKNFSFETEELRKKERVIGQLQNSYILVEKTDGLLILDQHAAHERIRYEYFMKKLQEKNYTGQKLLIPISINVSLEEEAILEKYHNFLHSLGFEIHKQTSQKFRITSVPEVCISQNIENLMKNFLDEFKSFQPERKQSIEEFQERLLTYLSCRKATMFGDTLDMKQMEKLYEDWLNCEKKETCPHGRDISFFIPISEIRKKVCR